LGRPWNRSQMYLHHTVFYDASQKDIMCPQDPMRWAAVGGEFTPIKISKGYALMFNAASSWVTSWDILSYLTQDNVQVYLTYKVTYVTALTNVIPVNCFWLDVTYCGGSDYNVSAGSGYSVNFANFTTSPGLNITIVFILGHLHPGGVNITLTNQDGFVYCMSVPTYSANDKWILSMSYCTQIINVAKDPYFYLESTYLQNPTHPLIDVMGIMLVYAHIWSA